MDAHQTARGSDRDAARLFRDTRPRLEVHGPSASLSVPGRDGAEVKLVVRVPDTVGCTVRTHHGDVAVSGLARPLAIDEDHGDVTLDSLRGPVHLQMDHGGVRARNLGGDLAIDGRADDVTLSGVHGKTTLDGEFFGDTAIDHAGGPVSFRSQRTELEAAHLTGALSLDGDSLRLDGAEGGLRIETRSKDIEAGGIRGPATIEDSNGDLGVSLLEPLGPVSLNVDTGNLTLTLPPDASCTVQGSAGGEDNIVSGFPLAQRESGGVKTLTGQIGQGGPVVALKTEHGDLSLRRGEGGKAERHLRSEGEPAEPVVQ